LSRIQLFDFWSFLAARCRNRPSTTLLVPLLTVGKPKKILNLDMSYMSLSLRHFMRQKGIRVNMKVRRQDFQRKRGPKFKFDEQNYLKKWLLERTNSWIKAFRRLRLRREYHSAMFKAFVYLALIIILIRHP